MSLPRLSITTLMAAMLTMAADLAWLRWFLILGHRSLFGFYPMALDLGIIPAASVLAMSLYVIASRRKRGAAFPIGFAAALSLSLIAYVGCCLTIPGTIDKTLQAILPPLQNGWASRLLGHLTYPIAALIASSGGRRYDLVEITWLMILLTGPQIMIALAGGWLATNLHGRRSRSEVEG